MLEWLGGFTLWFLILYIQNAVGPSKVCFPLNFLVIDSLFDIKDTR